MQFLSLSTFLVLLLFSELSFSEVTVFTLPAAESKGDKRYEYDFSAITLALEKTKEKYGPYNIKRLKAGANFKRFEKIASENSEPNFFFKQSIRSNIPFACVPFPVDLGIVSYRIAFLSKKVKSKIKNVNSLDELRKFTIIQGVGWLDNEILRANNFNVIVGSSFEGLFHMVAHQRGDIFTRGANEIYPEWNQYKHIKNFALDEHFSLYYPLPRFFCTHKANKLAFKRVHEGLIKAYEDGSYLRLWKKSYQKSLDFIKLDKRKIFRINNPFLKGVDPSYEKYIIKPLESSPLTTKE